MFAPQAYTLLLGCLCPSKFSLLPLLFAVYLSLHSHLVTLL